MTDRSIRDSFEQRIGAELERYVAGAYDPKPASEIAGAAMRPRSASVRLRNASRTRRLLLFGLAAMFLVPAAYFGSSLLRPPAPDIVPPPQIVPPALTQAPDPSLPAPQGYRAIVLRRGLTGEPGVSVIAVRPNGDEAVVRTVPDSFLSAGTIGHYGSVSSAGWLAMAGNADPWPVVLVDLRDPASEPWIAPFADAGGVGPRWGPTGLMAATAGSLSNVVIVDPETRATQRIVAPLPGGGPYIVWTADGSGILTAAGTQYSFVPIDGGPRVSGFPELQSYDLFGPDGAELRICSPGAGCLQDDGHVDRIELDGSTQTIFREEGPDRVIQARFGSAADEYWLTLDHNGGRQMDLVQLGSSGEEILATMDRNADWGSIGEGQVAPDGSLRAFSTYGANDQAGVVIVPQDGGPNTFHLGSMVGFAVAGAVESPGTGGFLPVSDPQPPVGGEAYQLPSLEQLIDAETTLNPGRTVLGQGAREGVAGETEINTYQVIPDASGPGSIYLDCIGPSAVSVDVGNHNLISPCLVAGTWSDNLDVTDGQPITVETTGDTTWRVVLYSEP
jgi:hypothetical protein